jgi:hypothetical protein
MGKRLHAGLENWRARIVWLDGNLHLWMPRSTVARRREHQERLIHGRAGGAYHARKARRWVSCLSQVCQCQFVSTANIPCPRVQPFQAERQARIWRGPSVGFWGTCAIVRWSQPRVWRFALYAQYRFAIVQRIAGHRIVFNAGCVSPLDARKRIALCSRDRAQEPD